MGRSRKKKKAGTAESGRATRKPSTKKRSRGATKAAADEAPQETKSKKARARASHESAPTAKRPRRSTGSAWANRLFAACCAVTVAGLVIAGAYPLNNTDTYGHLAQGRQIVELGHVPDVDHFSFWKAEPQPWHNYEWLSDLLFWTTYDLTGVTGLQILKLLVLALIAVLLLARLRPRGGRLPIEAAACTVLLIGQLAAVRFRLSVRPHVLGIALAALLLHGLHRIAEASAATSGKRVARRWIVGLVIAHVVWVNLHGSHLLGLLLTGLYLLAFVRDATARKRFGALLGGQLVASCVSPFGPLVLTDAIEHVLDPRYRDLVSEWAPWGSDDDPWFMIATAVSVLALAIVAIPLKRKGPRGVAPLLCACLLAVMAMRSLRFAAEFILLSAPILALGARSLLERMPPARAMAGAAAATVVAAVIAVVGAASLPPMLPVGVGETGWLLPRASGQHLERHAPGARVFGSLEDSWYLMFAAPSARFFIDGRAPFYGPAHIERMRRGFASGAAFEAIADGYELDAVVLKFGLSAHRPLLSHLSAHARWHVVVIEDRQALFLRDTGQREIMPLRALRPAYDAQPLLAESADVGAIRRELDVLNDYDGTAGYRSWVRAMLSLRSLARAEDRAGLRAPETDAEREAAEGALAALNRAAEVVPEVPVVQAYRAMAAVAACDLDTARTALAEATRKASSREALLVGAELDLREGDTSAVERFLDGADRLDPSGQDPWVDAVRQDLAAGVRCPSRR